jgi:sucrose phosphorylase
LIVQLLRAVMDDLAPHVVLLTETNVPQAENATYFGDGTNEAHLIYNFPLPPLVLYSFQTATATALADWARSLTWPSDESMYFNILASHDGIGLNPVRGILAKDEIEKLTRSVEKGVGRLSLKSNPDGTTSPYEINANYFDALQRPGEMTGMDLQVQRFITAHAILLAFKGLPGLYFHSLFGSRGWPAGVTQTGRERSINREKLDQDELTAELRDAGSLRSQIYYRLRHLLGVRSRLPAFSPQAAQRVLDGGRSIFAVLRGNRDSAAQVLCLHNVSAEQQSFRCKQATAPMRCSAAVNDAISAKPVAWQPEDTLMLKPFESMWLTF